jgi:hypothetical protein
MIDATERVPSAQSHRLFFCFLSLLGAASACAKPVVNTETARETPPPATIVDIQDRASDAATEPYPLPNTNQKLVNDHGDGFEPLYGTRNVRAVLAGTLYRGGANNKYFRYGVRDNRNPLPDLGLQNLCEEGFSTAVYLYSTNYETAPKKVDCVNRRTGASHTLKYEQIGPYNEASVRELLSIVYRKLKNPTEGPAYFHCWNGWHASGLISAYTLRQFCGVSGAEAVSYWDANTDGNNTDPAFATIRKNIRDFTPYSDLQLTSAERAAVCLPLTRR